MGTWAALWALLALATSAIAARVPAATAGAEPAAGAPRPRNLGPDVAYVGDASCAGCHRREASTYPATAMGRSLARPEELIASGLLDLPPEGVSFLHERSRSRYRIVVKGGRLLHEEVRLDENGKDAFTDSRPIAFALGSGDRGQTFLVSQGGRLYQSPVAFRRHRDGWGMAAGYDRPRHHRFSRPVTGPCLFCHANRALYVEGTLNEYREPVFEGLAIGCERCHGPGGLHVKDRRAGPPSASGVDSSIVNPRRLAPDLRDSVCFQCHLQGAARVVRAGRGLHDFRPGLFLGEYFAVFDAAAPAGAADPSASEGIEVVSHVERLRRSRCWKESGGRITCITCHDPHHTPRGEEASRQFGRACLTCHQLADCRLDEMASRAGLPDADPRDCVRCHMGKRPPTDAPHTLFTDHWIQRRPAPEQSGPGPGGPGAREAPIELVDFFPDRPAGDRDRGAAYLVLASREGDRRYAERGAAILEPMRPRLAGDVNALRLLSDHYIAAGRRGDAAAALESLGARAPQTAEFLVALARVLQRLGRPAEGLERARRAVSEDPAYAQGRLTLGDLLMDAGRLDEAAAEQREAIRLDPTLAGAHARLGEALLARGEQARARAALETALALEPGQLRARLALARILLSGGDREGALACLRRAVREAPDGPSRASARVQLALTLEGAGRRAEAAAELEAALADDPSDEEARRMLRRLSPR